LDKAGTQTWFHVYSQEDMIELVVIGQGPHATALSKPGAGDHRLLGRMPGYALREQAETRTFDEVDFQVVDAEGTSSDVMVQGARHSVSYAPAEDGAIASDLDIHLAYRSAIRALGGEILRAEKSHTTARVLDGGQVTWVK